MGSPDGIPQFGGLHRRKNWQISSCFCAPSGRATVSDQLFMWMAAGLNVVA